ARQLGLTENTVKEHVSAILQRLGVRTRIQIISRMERFRLTGSA
ncbi:LuxR C-terminal-related transcriptional regulator, partial [Ralstonia pseudosolanacearum]